MQVVHKSFWRTPIYLLLSRGNHSRLNFIVWFIDLKLMCTTSLILSLSNYIQTMILNLFKQEICYTWLIYNHFHWIWKWSLNISQLYRKCELSFQPNCWQLTKKGRDIFNRKKCITTETCNYQNPQLECFFNKTKIYNRKSTKIKHHTKNYTIKE